LDQLDKQDHEEVKEKKVNPPTQVWQDQQDQREALDHEDQSETKELRDHLDQLDQPDNQDHQPQLFSHRGQTAEETHLRLHCTMMDTDTTRARMAKTSTLRTLSSLEPSTIIFSKLMSLCKVLYDQMEVSTS
jgi:hypothetical protein